MLPIETKLRFIRKQPQRSAWRSRLRGLRKIAATVATAPSR
jgi:hypothetical protein